MQFTNNLSGPGNRQSSKRIVIVAVIAFVVLGIALLFYVGRRNSSPEGTGEYYDPASGETISNPTGRSPEKFNQASEQPVYLGFSRLVDIGLSQFQVDVIKQIFLSYSSQRKDKINELSIYKDSVSRVSFDPADEIRSVLFDISINRGERYSVTMQYTTLRNAKIIIYEGKNKIFESGFVDYAPPSNVESLEVDPDLD